MFNISGDVTRKALAILAWPAFQILALRVLLHSFLQIRFGFVNATDYDFLLPAPIAFIVLMHAVDKNRSQPLGFNQRFFLLNLLSTALFIITNWQFDFIAWHNPLGAASLWFASLFTVILTGFCIWIKPSFYIQNENRFAFLPCTLIATSLSLYTYGFSQGWNFLGKLTANIIYTLFAKLPWLHTTSGFNAEAEVTLHHPLFAVRIGKACGGFDSFFYFSLVFLLAYTLHGKALQVLRWLAGYVSGLVLMFALNIFRIVTLFYVGIGLQQVLTHKTAINTFKLFFHTHSGWLLYTAAIYFYLKIFNTWLEKSLPAKLKLPTTDQSLSAT